MKAGKQAFILRVMFCSGNGISVLVVYERKTCEVNMNVAHLLTGWGDIEKVF